MSNVHRVLCYNKVLTLSKMLKMKKPLIIPLLIVILLIVVFLFVSVRLSSVIIFIPGVIVTYFVFLNTFYKKAPDPEKILPLYLLAVGIQLLHFTEEYLTGFIVALPGLLGQEAYPMDYWIVFNMVAYFIFILGGIILFKEVKELMVIPLFFILVGVVFNSIAHILLSIYVGGYFSGLFTALIYAAIAPVLVQRVLEVNKNLETN